MKLDFCAVCGRKHNLEHHHFIPKSQGGSDKNINMLTLCAKCHGVIHGVTESKTRWTASHRKLQAEGVAKAKAAGKYKGRQKSIDREVVLKMLDAGHGATAIANELGIGRKTVYRIKAELTDRFSL